jgi:tetratricopeptide (TPR) repeat protein
MSQEHLALCDLLAKVYWLLEQRGAPEKTKGLDATELEQALLAACDSLGRESPRDVSILAQLAQFQSDRAASEEEFNRHLSRAGQYARQALARPEIGHHARVNALDVLANQQYTAGDYRGAIATYRQLTGLRRWAADSYNLGLSLGKQRQYDLAEQAFRDAIDIDASYPLPYQSLAVLYRSIDPNASRQMTSIAQSLLKNTRSPMATDSEAASQSDTPEDEVDGPGR